MVINQSKARNLHCYLLMAILAIILAMAAVPIAVAQVSWSNDAINYRDNYLGPPGYCILCGTGIPSYDFCQDAYEMIVTNATSRAEATDGVVDVDDLEYVMADYLVDNNPYWYPNMTVAYAAVASWEAACGWPPPTVMSVEPSYIEVAEPSLTFLVNISVTNVTNMQSFEFKLGFDTGILTVDGADEYGRDTLGNVISSAYVAANAFIYAPMTEIPPGSGNYEWTPLQNVTQGFVWVAVGFSVWQAFTGSGTLMTINFTALAPGNSTLHLFGTVVVNPSVKIPHRWHDGFVHVIPEFPATIITPLLLVATLASAFLGKTVWSRKREDCLAAE